MGILILSRIDWDHDNYGMPETPITPASNLKTHQPISSLLPDQEAPIPSKQQINAIKTWQGIAETFSVVRKYSVLPADKSQREDIHKRINKSKLLLNVMAGNKIIPQDGATLLCDYLDEIYNEVCLTAISDKTVKPNYSSLAMTRLENRLANLNKLNDKISFPTAMKKLVIKELQRDINTLSDKELLEQDNWLAFQEETQELCRRAKYQIDELSP